MNKMLMSFLITLCTLDLNGQNYFGSYNPYLNSGTIIPSPLWPVEADGTGTISFNVGNTGNSPLDVYPGNTIILSINLSYGVPVNNDPLLAIEGTFAGLFKWTYSLGIYTGTQTSAIPANSSGNITIAYKVTQNSTYAIPRNGFSASLTPAPYQTLSNNTIDDVLSLYTYTEIRDFGDAPASYGSADHGIDFKNYMGITIDGESADQPSANADGDDINNLDDEDGVIFPTMTRGTKADISVTVAGTGYINAWIDWNGDGDFNDSNEMIVNNTPAAAGVTDISIDVPQNAIVSRPTFARFRFGPNSTKKPTYSRTGSATYGEVEDYQITIFCAPPSPPVVGTITQPTCTLPTGTVILNGLPSTGTWTLVRYPDNIITTGKGTSTTISGLEAGTYTFTVTNDADCASSSSENVVINPQPPTPASPVPGTITQPSCSVATGSVSLSGLPSGTWTINPGKVTGSTSSTILTGLEPGTYNYTVTNSYGCTSGASSDVIIDAQPLSPAGPVEIIDCSLGFNHAIITVTSPTGPGFFYRLDDGAFQSSTSFAGIVNGTHTITVRNSSGCTTTGAGFSVLCSCSNEPTVTLSSLTGSICGTATPFKVSGNTFGGTATNVTITENGAGTVSPSFTNSSPFDFTYTPASGDADKTVLITVTTDNPLGAPCKVNTATFALSVNARPSAPLTGSIVDPTCILPTGSVTLNGLPSTGTWTLIRNPGGVITTGTGTTTNISGLSPGSYNFTVTNASGCISEPSSNVVINSIPLSISAPIVGTITQPTCILSTGSVTLSGLPSTGSWTLVRYPGGVAVTGSGLTRTLYGLSEGTHTFTVTNSEGCTSLPSSGVVINAQPETPAAPVAGSVTQPSCDIPTGNVLLTGLPVNGTWTLTRYPGTIRSTGTGASTTVSGLATGTYNFTVASSEGCVSLISGNIIIAKQPPTPSAPVVGTIIQPTCVVPSGSVVLTGLPSHEKWTLTRFPGGTTSSGTGTSISVSGLLVGSYNFTVTNSAGCQSLPSANVVIPSNPAAPVVIITNPPPVCSPSTIDLTSASVTSGSTPGLTYTYWRNQAATIAYNTPASATSGTYYIKGTTSSLCSDIKPVTVTVRQNPSANAGPDQVLDYLFSTNLDASTPDINETGNWSVFSGSGSFSDPNFAMSSVSDLSVGKNVLLWSITNGVCPPAVDSVTITVQDLIIPTLITPNNDGRNEYFLVRGLQSRGKTELVIFNRRGERVFINEDYDNRWNGVDYNGNPLPDDTYFFLIRPENGKARTGFIVIRK